MERYDTMKVNLFTKGATVFNPIPQLAGFAIAITFMSLPFVALTTLPLASAGLLKLGHLLGLLARSE